MRFLFLFLLFIPSLSFATDAEVSLVSTNSGKMGDAVAMLAGSGNWRADKQMQFVKLDLRFNSAVTITKVEVQSCGPSFTEGADLYVNFDEQHAFSEGGKPIFSFIPAASLANVSARALTFNFRYNNDVCISAIRLFNGEKIVKLAVRTEKLRGSGTAVALHDGRLDTTWSPDETGGSAVVEFPEPAKIKQVRIWNGDQRSDNKFRLLPRVKTLAIIGEDQRAVVAVKDLKGMQTLDLSNTIKGKVIRVVVEEAYEGLPKNARLSELQLGTADDFYVVDVSRGLQATADARKAGFKAAALDNVLDRNLVVNDDSTLAVRVRGDGTFFMRGESENLNRARTFSYLGSYTIEESHKHGVRLKTMGYMTNPAHEQDSSTCGRDCAENPGPEALYIVDEISIGRGTNGTVFVRDEGPRRALGLEFHALKARVAKDSQ